ncbi:hypothetical protein ACQKMV_19030 [Lysinibacillus sp. NPDC094403]|uniref:hypothetical protein n=1 Tax=Lysinibacillus sp. NPDC094403 TaxID=3390581 RepID=UPI003D077334
MFFNHHQSTPILIVVAKTKFLLSFFYCPSGAARLYGNENAARPKGGGIYSGIKYLMIEPRVPNVLDIKDPTHPIRKLAIKNVISTVLASPFIHVLSV